MPKYILTFYDINSCEQASITTTEGHANTPEEFLERCFQYYEVNLEEVPDPSLICKRTEPENFGCAGGFVRERTTFYDDQGNNLADILNRFPW